MKSFKIASVCLLLLTGASSFAQAKPQPSVFDKYQWKEERAGGFSYKYVENDPMKTRFYTLKNGLTVILSPTHKEPRMHFFIAVKAGSKTDPADHTGLAHYLEHMMFKGTPNYGSLDWSK